MSNLLREQRLDKNGKLNTKLVRATPKAAGNVSQVPAPSLGSASASKGSKGAQGAYKPRASQLKQQHYGLETETFTASPELKTPSQEFRISYHSFKASEVEMYSVFSVASAGDTMELLSRGIRSADEARDFLVSNGFEHLIKDNAAYTQEALKRNLKIDKFMEVFDATPSTHFESPHVMDAMEFRCTASISGQYHWLKPQILSGEIRFDDIKQIGAPKFKSYRRLYYSKEALIAIQKDDAKFTHDDMRNLLDRASQEKADERTYETAATYLINEGPEFIAGIDRLKELFYIDRGHGGKKDRVERTKYELEFLKQYRNADSEGGTFHTTVTIRELYDAKVPVDEAARLMAEGLPVREVVAVAVEGINKPLADGWL